MDDKSKGENVKKAIAHIWNFLENFIPLANTHGSEFISQSHWEKFVPEAMYPQLLALSHPELVSLPLGLPLSQCDEYQKDNLYSYIATAISCHLENLNVLSPLEEACSISKGAVTESMSEKKSHEVEIMANAIAGMAESCQADLVVDVGSGKGYLSLELAGHHKMNVLGLDSRDSNTHNAQHRKEKLKTRWPALVAKTDDDVQNYTEASKEGRLEAKKTMDRYVPVTQYVSPDMNLSSILSQQAASSLCGETPPDQARAVIAGLHTCGSLAVSAKRLCLQDTGAVALCLVACCYHLMEEEGGDIGEVVTDTHFPLSLYGKSLGLRLGRNARNLASQSVHRIAASGQLQGEEFYRRALLDVMIEKLDLSHSGRITGIRGLNKRNASLTDYTIKAFEKLGFPVHLITPDFISEMETQYESERIKMAAFFQLKLALAPAIEALILLDRLMFLHEQPCIGKAELVRLFDPVTSPRCYALFATKGNVGT